jgi:hypothetical protein
MIAETHPPPTSPPTVPFTGSPAATCPITLSPIHELTHAVAFSYDPAQPYELAPLWTWILLSDRHPLSGETCFLSDIAALRLPWQEEEAVGAAQTTLATLRNTMWDSQDVRVGRCG